MSTTPLPVREAEQRRALDVLVLAFAADPAERWLYPEAHQYLTHFPKFLAAFGGAAFTHETVWELGDFSAVAMWLPPRVEMDDGHPKFRIGTWHGSASIRPCKAGASAAN